MAPTSIWRVTLDMLAQKYLPYVPMQSVYHTCRILNKTGKNCGFLMNVKTKIHKNHFTCYRIVIFRERDRRVKDRRTDVRGEHTLFFVILILFTPLFVCEINK